ncbi:MAG: cytochrome c [Acidobacteriota bacterium]|nr:cytochrome c [Acidobacteriota bacterium]
MIIKAKIISREQIRKKHEKIFRESLFCLRGCVFLLVISSFAASCAQKMASQPSARPLEPSSFFADKQSARQPVAGTIPSGFTETGERVAAEESFDKNSNQLPFPLTEEVLQRGRERFEINCAVCHGKTGDGNGMIVKRGFSPPPTFLSEHLRNHPLGHFYDVITNGYGGMGAYAAQVEPRDRWAIAAYIRALQISQNATVQDVPAEKLGDLEKK